MSFDQQTLVMVATLAFGMGIDKPNVRYVIHVCMPKSLDDYMQESGRAGKDGNVAHSVIFYYGGDLLARWKMIRKDHPITGTPEELEATVGELILLANYCNNKYDCLRQIQAEYFGETFDPARCGRDGYEKCENCETKLRRRIRSPQKRAFHKTNEYTSLFQEHYEMMNLSTLARLIVETVIIINDGPRGRNRVTVLQLIEILRAQKKYQREGNY